MRTVKHVTQTSARYKGKFPTKWKCPQAQSLCQKNWPFRIRNSKCKPDGQPHNLKSPDSTQVWSKDGHVCIIFNALYGPTPVGELNTSQQLVNSRVKGIGQALVPQAGHPLPRQLPHQVSLFYMREFLIYKPLITQKRFLRELSSRLSELLTSKYFFEVCKKHDDTSNQFCLSKSSLIGFEMDYFNQTVNLRHVASVDRWKTTEGCSYQSSR